MSLGQSNTGQKDRPEGPALQSPPREQRRVQRGDAKAGDFRKAPCSHGQDEGPLLWAPRLNITLSPLNLGSGRNASGPLAIHPWLLLLPLTVGPSGRPGFLLISS